MIGDRTLRTASGLRIGSGYQPRQRIRMDSYDLGIQRALLDSTHKDTPGRRWYPAVLCIVCLLALVVIGATA